MNRKRVFSIASILFVGIVSLPLILQAGPPEKSATTDATAEKPPIPYVQGMFRHILHPPGKKEAQKKHPGQQWYINDHCFYVADDGTIYWFGITNPYPKDGNLYGPGTHRHIGHATAKKPFGPWTEHEHAIALPEGTKKCVGASFVVRYKDQYIMLYGYNTGFHIAVSKDLKTWKMLKDKPEIKIGLAGTRDACIIKLKDGTYLLYGAAGQIGGAGVGLASSSNCIDWKLEKPALLSNVPGKWGPLESPFVLYRKGWYYMFINHSHRQYQETIVFTSRDPRKFDWKKPLCTLFGHASEIFEFEGKTYISHCGIEDKHWQDTGAHFGLYLAELGWLEN